MNLFDIMKKTASKEVLFFNEPSVSLKCIIAINNTTLGPAVCSCKIFDYGSFDEAINDALNIAAFNTYGAALMRRDVGGGSIIMWGDPDVVKSEMYFRTLGAFINKLNGKIYVTGESGTSSLDLFDIKRESQYVLGLPEIYGGSGNTSVSTAKGVLQGIKAAVKELFDKSDIKGLKVAIQGVGKVGSQLVKVLVSRGADVTITDLKYDKVKDMQDKYPGITCVKPADIFKVDCDVFSPCAFNNSITSENINDLQCKIIAGATNCVLESCDLYEVLREKGIWLIPGFIINSGEIIQVSNELMGYSLEKTETELKTIYTKTLEIIQESRKKKESVSNIALDIANNYIQDISKIKMIIQR
ncbi:leucine dehydrogenase [bacterium]|nr:leucine dehydrogenase [bacterium]